LTLGTLVIGPLLAGAVTAGYGRLEGVAYLAHLLLDVLSSVLMSGGREESRNVKDYQSLRLQIVGGLLCV
jgi:hypothetical protein